MSESRYVFFTLVVYFNDGNTISWNHRVYGVDDGSKDDTIRDCLSRLEEEIEEWEEPFWSNKDYTKDLPILIRLDKILYIKCKRKNDD